MSDRPSRWWTLCLLLGLFCPRVSEAQSAGDRATARRFAEEADDKAKHKDFAGAIDLFTRADSLVPAPTLKLEIARLRVQMGQLVEGQQLMLEISRGQPTAGEPPSWGHARTAAASEAAALNARLSALEVTLEGASADAPPRVLLDGQPLPPAVLGAPRVVNPGSHALRAEQDGKSLVDMTVQVREGQTQKVVLRVPAAAGGASQATSATTPAEKTPANDAWHRGLYLRLGLGAVAHASTPTDNVTILGVQTSSKRDVSGGGPALDFAIGATVAPGLILAADIGAHAVSNPKVTCDTCDTTTQKGTVTYTRIGVLGDYYFGNGGLHVQAGIAYVGVKFAPDTPIPNYPDVDLKGVGISAGIGYEFRVARTWGLGGLLRFDVPTLKQSTNIGGAADDRTLSGFVPGILITATDS